MQGGDEDYYLLLPGNAPCSIPRAAVHSHPQQRHKASVILSINMRPKRPLDFELGQLSQHTRQQTAILIRITCGLRGHQGECFGLASNVPPEQENRRDMNKCFLYKKQRHVVNIIIIIIKVPQYCGVILWKILLCCISARCELQTKIQDC